MFLHPFDVGAASELHCGDPTVRINPEARVPWTWSWWLSDGAGVSRQLNLMMQSSLGSANVNVPLQGELFTVMLPVSAHPYNTYMLHHVA